MTLNEWDDYAAGWDANDDVRTYAENAFESLTRKVPALVTDLTNSRVLDFGCGTGLLSEKFAPICGEIMAVDTSPKMIEEMRRKVMEANIRNIVALEIDISAATIKESPDLTSGFDLVVTSSVCSFLPDYERTLGDLTSVINPGGIFVQWDWIVDMPVERIQGAFETAGLVEVSAEEAFALKTNGDSMAVVMGIGRR